MGGVVAHETLLSAPVPIGIGIRGLGLGLDDSVHNSLDLGLGLINFLCHIIVKILSVSVWQSCDQVVSVCTLVPPPPQV